MIDPEKIKCYIDDEEVDCEELKYVPYVEEESSTPPYFLS